MEQLIEWKDDHVAYECDDYKYIISIGKLGGIMVAKYDYDNGWLWCDYGAINTKHDSLDEAKTKAEELLAAWLKEANLVVKPTKCDKCGDSGEVFHDRKYFSEHHMEWMSSSEKKSCPCTREPNSLFNFIKNLNGE
jgi:hypothetical protein